MERLEDLLRDLVLIACILSTEVHVEFCNLVSIHAGSRHLDWSSPVEVVVAKVKSELFHYLLCQLRVVEGHIEVSWEHTALSSELRNQIEVVLFVRVFILNDLGVNNAARWWIDQCSLSIVNEEPLSDSLVDYDQSDGWFLGTLVVHLVDHLLELSDLLLNDLSSHGITDTVSVDDEVVREHSLGMLVFIGLNGVLQCFSQVGIDNFLSFLLQNLVRVVLTEFLIDGCTETDNGLPSLMADINTDEHGVG